MAKNISFFASHPINFINFVAYINELYIYGFVKEHVVINEEHVVIYICIIYNNVYVNHDSRLDNS